MARLEALNLSRLLTGRLAPFRYQMLAAGGEPSGDDPSVGDGRGKLNKIHFPLFPHYLILLALPACPKEIMRSMQTCFMAARAGFR